MWVCPAGMQMTAPSTTSEVLRPPHPRVPRPFCMERDRGGPCSALAAGLTHLSPWPTGARGGQPGRPRREAVRLGGVRQHV